MAETATRSSGSQRQPTRLQRFAPASIQISPVSDWNIAIPLLSPLATSPPPSRHLTADMTSCSVSQRKLEKEPQKPTAFKKWQHPAAPFSYEAAPLVAFICTGAVERM